MEISGRQGGTLGSDRLTQSENKSCFDVGFGDTDKKTGGGRADDVKVFLASEKDGQD